MHVHEINIPVTKLGIAVNIQGNSVSCLAAVSVQMGLLKDQTHLVHESKNLGVFYKTNS